MREPWRPPALDRFGAELRHRERMDSLERAIANVRTACWLLLIALVAELAALVVILLR